MTNWLAAVTFVMGLTVCVLSLVTLIVLGIGSRREPADSIAHSDPGIEIMNRRDQPIYVYTGSLETAKSQGVRLSPGDSLWLGEQFVGKFCVMPENRRPGRNRL